LDQPQEQQFREGIKIEGRRTAPAGLKLVKPGPSPWYEVRLIEGRTHQIKLMFAHFDRLVEKLKRVRIGFLELGGLPAGEFRMLTPEEVARFKRLLKMDVNEPRSSNQESRSGRRKRVH
jgi:23S rRNA pseudouridine2605 synthase